MARMRSASSDDSIRRWSEANPCQVCTGFPSLPSGRSVRCYGFLSSDARYAHCTREEYAVGLPCTTASGTYAHRLTGTCRCGSSHGTAQRSRLARRVVQTSPGGLTLRDYSVQKRLPFDFLQGLGLRDVTYAGESAILIPYPDAKGGAPVSRFRTLGGHRWKKGAKARAYGLDRLALARTVGYSVLVEGESDAQTLWYHDVPALGLPGAGMWREEWAAHLDGIQTLYVVIEPDGGGESMIAWLAQSAIRTRTKLIRLKGGKDPSAFYLLDPETFRERWQHVLDEAGSWHDANHTDAHAEPLVEHTLPQVIAVFRRWLYLPDISQLLAVLAAVTANLMPGDPVWLLVVGPPSSGKSELVQALDRLAFTFTAGVLTEASLLSGTPQKDTVRGAKGGLLRQIGDFGILTLKDFTSVLSMARDARAMLLAALREVYDGAWTRHVGADGGRELAWRGKLGLIAGVTPTIATHHAVMSTMGERFVLIRMDGGDGETQAKRALQQAGSEAEMRRELSAAVAGLFAHLDLSVAPTPLCREDQDRVVTLASLAARARSAVDRDSYKREIEQIPAPEAPARLAKVLSRLFIGLLVLGVDRAEAWQVITAIALDSIPALRRLLLRQLALADGWTETSVVAAQCGYPTTTTRRSLEDLNVHKLVVRRSDGNGKADQWRLTDWARTRWDAATVPEKAGGMKDHEDGGGPLSNEHRAFDAFSGTVDDVE